MERIKGICGCPGREQEVIVTCEQCGCVFTCNEDDWNTWYDKNSLRRGYDIKCPCCNEAIDKTANVYITKNNEDK